MKTTNKFFGEFTVLKLMEPSTRYGRIITTEYFFMSTSLVVKILYKKTTIVGNFYGNKIELSKFAKQGKNDITDQMARKYSMKSKSQTWSAMGGAKKYQYLKSLSDMRSGQ
ncbi:piggyBac transposable element-derived protein 4-like [Vespula squamosa]|uniref:PiggyBac transposable element-derived protein 4-like n=1 Tax=Vespula squamosa TaxID=30214 RepID=A0ABD2BTX9_VESSQ